jgi:hypothetical protein
VDADDPPVRRFDPPRPVLVHHDDGHWYTGFCEGWVRWPDGWRASVDWTVTPGEKYVRVLSADRVRLADE